MWPLGITHINLPAALPLSDKAPKISRMVQRIFIALSLMLKPVERLYIICLGARLAATVPANASVLDIDMKAAMESSTKGVGEKTATPAGQ